MVPATGRFHGNEQASPQDSIHIRAVSVAEQSAVRTADAGVIQPSTRDSAQSHPTSFGESAVPRRIRPRVAPTEDRQQLRLLLNWPEQLA